MDVSRDTVDRKKCYGFQKYSETSWGHENLSKSGRRSRKLINSVTLIATIFNNPVFWSNYIRKTIQNNIKNERFRVNTCRNIFHKINFTKNILNIIPNNGFFVTTKQSYSQLKCWIKKWFLTSFLNVSESPWVIKTVEIQFKKIKNIIL